jgi:hypothetical protein
VPTPDPAQLSVSIVHFDDEVSTVSNIPDVLFNTYAASCSAWIDITKCRYDRYVTEFVINPTAGAAVRVRYLLTSDLDECRTALTKLDPSTDIAIFDLMREDAINGVFDAVGNKLLDDARRAGIDPSRVYILSGFPNLIAETMSDMTLAESQLLRKPIAAVEMAVKLSQMFPPHVRLPK